jgi:serine/threonine-protein kinase
LPAPRASSVFSTYVVDQSLSGQAQHLKEYTIALEVFDRTADYNPRIDAVVRVEARRLRRETR